MKKFYGTKRFKIGVAALFVILLAGIIYLNIDQPSSVTYQESLKAFNTVQTAYKEERNLTSYELNDLDRFDKLKTDLVGKYNNGTATKTEENDAVLLYAVGKVVALYEEGKAGSEEFSKDYSQAKVLLNKK